MTVADGGCVICSRRENVRYCFLLAGGFPLCPSCRLLAGRKFSRRRGRAKRMVEVPGRAEWVQALKKAWDPASGSFRCQISGVRLDPGNRRSARYPTVEHTTPGGCAGGWLVVAAVVNDMKSDLSLSEFKEAVPLLTTILSKGAGEAQQEVAALEALLNGLEHFKR